MKINSNTYWEYEKSWSCHFLSSDWLIDWGLPAEFEKDSPDVLNRNLWEYYTEQGSSLVNFRAGLNMYTQPFNCAFNVIRDREFHSSNRFFMEWLAFFVKQDWTGLSIKCCVWGGYEEIVFLWCFGHGRSRVTATQNICGNSFALLQEGVRRIGWVDEVQLWNLTVMVAVMWLLHTMNLKKIFRVRLQETLYRRHCLWATDVRAGWGSVSIGKFQSLLVKVA